ncbi:MAG: shikimate dehydrogenase [Candidatus Omnitrophica bacterium]|nr:shikimate dehydrogenase [Candidatus Omnitrophota bacterium]MDD5430022.1 shikimate dehydrogenase [Candidatus Omnitrophota bacterium]
MHKKKKTIYGLIGFPVKHSLSPAMHNAAFDHFRISAEYRLFETSPEALEDFLLNNKELAGFNITIPHKVKACQILEKNFPPSKNKIWTERSLYYVKLSGAVNTVNRTSSGLEYFNTDAEGFLRSAKEKFKFSFGGKTVLLVGCGGAGRAVIAALSWKNLGVKKIYIYDLSQAAIDSLQKHFLSLPEEWRRTLKQKIEFISDAQVAEKIKFCQLLVNASPVGMKEGDPLLIDKNLLHKGLFVYDVVYNRETELIKEARLKGLPAIGGLGMLLYQGVIAWEIWTGMHAPVKEMKEALLKQKVG